MIYYKKVLILKSQSFIIYKEFRTPVLSIIMIFDSIYRYNYTALLASVMTEVSHLLKLLSQINLEEYSKNKFKLYTPII